MDEKECLIGGSRLAKNFTLDEFLSTNQDKPTWDEIQKEDIQIKYIRNRMEKSVNEIPNPLPGHQTLAKYTRVKVYSRPKDEIKVVKLLGSGNYGAAYLARYIASNEEVVIKVGDIKDIIQEYFVGAYGVNVLCDILPNFMYTYGYFTCGYVHQLDDGSLRVCEEKDLDGSKAARAIKKNAEKVASLEAQGIDPYSGQEYLRESGFGEPKGYIVLEKINGKTLESMLDNLTVKEMCQIFIQIFLAIQIAQEHPIGFNHSDLRPANVMIKEYDTLQQVSYPYRGNVYTVSTKFIPVLIDYGLSTIKLKDKGDIDKHIGCVRLGFISLYPAVIPGNDPFCLIAMCYDYLLGALGTGVMVKKKLDILLSLLQFSEVIKEPNDMEKIREDFGYISDTRKKGRWITPYDYTIQILRKFKETYGESMKLDLKISGQVSPYCEVITRDYPFLEISTSLSQELCQKTTLRSGLVSRYRIMKGEDVKEVDESLDRDITVFNKYKGYTIPSSTFPLISQNPTLEDLEAFKEYYIFHQKMKEHTALSYYILHLKLDKEFNIGVFYRSGQLEAYKRFYPLVEEYIILVDTLYVLRDLTSKQDDIVTALAILISNPPSIYN